MKRTFKFSASVLLLASAVAVSCQKEESASSSVAGLPVQSDLVTLTISAETATKAPTASISDAAKNTLQVFVFTTDGALETDKRVEAGTLQIGSRTGEKHIWAVVNAPAITVTSESELRAAAVSLASCSATSVVMAGSTTETITSTSDRIDISVDRLVAKVSLQNVSVNFTGNSLDGKTFIVKDLYLKNVAGSTNIAGNAAMNAITWYNKLTRESGAPAVIEDTGLNTTVNAGGATTGTAAVNRTWFTCPNSASDSAAGQESTWSPRRTRLVMHATVGGEDTYYTFDLPSLARNHSYNITSITVTMKGKDNDNNDEKTSSGALNMDITVNPWTGEDDITYTY